MYKNNEIDLNSIIGTITRYKWSIIFITLLFTLAVGIYAYFLVPIYSTSTLISIENKKSLDLTALLPGAKNVSEDVNSLDTNIRILKSRKIISKVLDKIDLQVRYFIRKRHKNIEISNSPIRVKILSNKTPLRDILFTVVANDEESFVLSSDSLKYNAVVKYGEVVTIKDLSLQIDKVGKIENFPYLFQINTDKLNLTQKIIQNLKIQKPSDDLLELIYSDTIPIRTKRVVDEIAKVYIEYRLDRKTMENEKTLNFLDSRLKFIRETLKNYGNKLKSFQAKNSLISAAASGGGKNIIEKLTENETKLTELNLQLKTISQLKDKRSFSNEDIINLQSIGIANTQLSIWMENIRQKKEELEILQSQKRNFGVSVTSDASLNVFLQVLRDKTELLKTLREDFTVNHPKVIQVKKEIYRIKRNINRQLNTKISQLQQAIYMLESNIKKSINTIYENIQKQYDTLSQLIHKDKKTLHNLPDVNMKLTDLKRNFTLTENIYTFLLQKRMEVEISKASTVVNTQVVDEALVPTKPIKPNKKFLLASGFLIGLILGIALAFLRALMDDKIRSLEDISKLIDIPIYGAIPLQKFKFAFKESFRTIRTNLEFIIPQRKDCKVILISSSVPKEGKTTISANLSKILSVAAKKVLILDLDMRKPRLFEEFGLENKKGMSTYLIGKHDLEEVIEPINEHLDFFPSGPVSPNPSELIMSKKFEETLYELMEEYEYIVIDTSPIGMVSDANLLLKYIDILLLVTRANYTAKEMIREFNKMIEGKEVHSVGIILNEAPLDLRKGYGYGYGYGYGERELENALTKENNEDDIDIEIENYNPPSS